MCGRPFRSKRNFESGCPWSGADMCAAFDAAHTPPARMGVRGSPQARNELCNRAVLPAGAGSRARLGGDASGSLCSGSTTPGAHSAVQPGPSGRDPARLPAELLAHLQPAGRPPACFLDEPLANRYFTTLAKVPRQTRGRRPLPGSFIKSDQLSLGTNFHWWPILTPPPRAMVQPQFV